jgi:hypothetical protein
MADANLEGTQYEILGLAAVSKYEAAGIQNVVLDLRAGSRKIRIVQLLTALALLIFLMTDMLPSPAVILSAAAVFITVIIVGRRLLTTAIDDARKIFDGIDFGSHSGEFEGFASDPLFFKELVESGIATVGSSVVNVEGDILVLCEKTAK